MVERLVAAELPDGRGIGPWRPLLRAHATLMRQLENQLEQKTGLALADYDVLAQLAFADGGLRMTDLANRALISRSGMTRRVARLVDDPSRRACQCWRRPPAGRRISTMTCMSSMSRFLRPVSRAREGAFTSRRRRRPT